MKTRHIILIAVMVIIGLGRFALQQSSNRSASTTPQLKLTPEQEEIVKNGDVLDLLREENNTFDSILTEIESQEGNSKTDEDHNTPTETAEKEKSLRWQMLEMMGKDDIEGILAQLNTPAAKELESRLNATNQDYKASIIDFETWSIERNKINIALYPMLPADDNFSVKDVPRMELVKLINDGEIEEAVDLFFNSGYDEMAKAEARINRAKKAYQKGQIKSDELRVNIARVREFLKYNL